MTQPAGKHYLALIIGGLLLFPIYDKSTLAQKPPVVEGLPPPPPVPATAPPLLIDGVTPLPDIPLPLSPPPSPRSTSITIPVTPAPIFVNPERERRLYRVEVVGDNESTLARVKTVEPQAFIRSGEGIIQVGSFSDLKNAEQLRRQLIIQDLSAYVIQVEVPPVAVAKVDRPGGYFVIIPSRRRRSKRLVRRIVKSGLDAERVVRRKVNRRYHVEVGPFRWKREAEYWHTYFLSRGMDAQLYQGR